MKAICFTVIIILYGTLPTISQQDNTNSIDIREVFRIAIEEDLPDSTLYIQDRRLIFPPLPNDARFYNIFEEYLFEKYKGTKYFKNGRIQVKNGILIKNVQADYFNILLENLEFLRQFRFASFDRSDTFNNYWLRFSNCIFHHSVEAKEIMPGFKEVVEMYVIANMDNIYIGFNGCTFNNNTEGKFWFRLEQLKETDLSIDSCFFNGNFGIDGMNSGYNHVYIIANTFQDLKGWSENSPHDSSTYFNPQTSQCVNIKLVNVNKLIFTDNNIVSTTPFNDVKLSFNGNEVEITNNYFEPIIDLSGCTINERLTFKDNTFKSHVILKEFIFSDQQNYIYWDQFDGRKLASVHEGAFYFGQSDIELSNNKAYKELLKTYHTLSDLFLSNGDKESAERCYLEIKDLEVDKLKSDYKAEGSFQNLFGWIIGQTKIIFLKNDFLLISIALAFVIGLSLLIYTRRKKAVDRSSGFTSSGRHLAAIMFTDVVGYTSRMSEDENYALQLLDRNRNIHQELIKKFNGKWLKELGDGSLCSFPTATDAVKCAIEIQNKVLQDTDYKLRIGIHLGEVVYSKDDVFGDGVNIASRLEQEATEGGICISEPVFQNIRNRIKIDSTFLGEKYLKNVPDTVKLYLLDISH